jgi:NodT family efflux transporter outer membrane factor (OMF) lipoprotein
MTMLASLLICAALLDPAAWWQSYGDPVLTNLVQRALEVNLDVKKALARVAESRAVNRQAKSTLGPSIQLSASAQQLRGGFQNGVIRIPQPGEVGGASLITPFETSLISGGADMRWEISLWGPNSKLLDGARSEVRAQEESAQEVRLIVAAEVARAYFELRGAEQQLELLERHRLRQAEVLELTRRRAEAGLSPALDVDRQASALAALEAEIPRLESQRQIQLNRLAALLADRSLAQGGLPAAAGTWNVPPLGGGVDSALLLRRPDVRAAEARIAAAAARRKAARAELYPRVVLTGLSGRQSTNLSGLSLGSGNFFGIGPQLVLPVFTGGRLRANIEASEARLDQARIEYEQEILAAFQEAEDAIASYRAEQARLARLREASGSAESALRLSEDLYRAGLGDFLGVLDAQRSVLELEQAIALARTSALLQSVQLFKALAGGWPAPAGP